MKATISTAVLRTMVCCALAAIVGASASHAQDLIETAPVYDSLSSHGDPSVIVRTPSVSFTPPDSIDRSAHALSTYELGDVEHIAEIYRRDGMRWFYERHTPELLAPFLDSTNVPLIEYSFGRHRNPVMTSQAALAFYNGYLDTGSEEYLQIFKTNVDWLLDNHDEYYLRYDFPWQHAGRHLASGWVSAMAQGEALGAVSSAYHLTGEQKYLDAATGIFETLYRNTDDTWTFTIDDQDHYWLEEYPNQDTCHVLNGLLFGLWGLWNYYVITDDAFAVELFAAGIQSIVDSYHVWNIRDQDASRYCLHGLYYPFYHETHLRQLTDYLTYFDIPEFEDAAELFQLHPAISSSHEDVDFGMVALRDSAERRITFYNGGTDTLDIWSVTMEHAAFTTSKHAVLIPPNDSLVLPVTFTAFETGRIESTLSVVSNARSLVIRLAGTGVGLPLRAEETAVEFGDVLALATDTLELRVSNLTATEITIDSVVTGSTAFHVRDSLYSLDPIGSAVLPVIFAPRLTGRYSTDIVLYFGDDHLDVGVSGRALPPLRLRSVDGSSSIDFGNVLIGRSDTLKAIIENLGLVPVTVSEVRSPRADIEVLGGSAELDGQAAYSFRVVFTPLEKGTVRDSLEVATDVSLKPLRMALRADVSTGVFVDGGDGVPDSFGLDQNYPNPFAATTRIRYRVPEGSHVRLVIVNVLGQVVRTVKEKDENPGVHAFELDLTDLPGGVYFCRMEAGGFTETRRMVLL